ncbi:hypothetical protein ABZ816_41630 [Actinosynnema sp. NPDC047251]|nr:hypothetical protein [Saccharothrix espanaensis]
MNDLEDRVPSPQQRPEEDRVERDQTEVPQQLTGLEWLVRQAKRQRKD